MADEERDGVRRWLVTVGSVLAALPLLYVLSVGPAVWWFAKQGYPEEQVESLESFYGPLISIHNNCPPLATALDLYVELWE
jgi:hypothetical protein